MRNRGASHLVHFVVVLGVILVYLCFFFEIKASAEGVSVHEKFIIGVKKEDVLDDLIDPKVLPPLLCGEQHFLCLDQIKFACSQESSTSSGPSVTRPRISAALAGEEDTDRKSEASSMRDSTNLPSSWSSFFSFSNACNWVTERLPKRPGSGL